jgi:cytochrome P450
MQRRRGDPLAALLTERALDDPYPLYRELRHRGPVQPTVAGFVVFGHAEANEILRSPAWGSDPRKVRGATASSLDERAADLADVSGIGNSLLNLDPPEHTRLRGSVSRAFTPRAIERLRSDAEEAAAMLLAPALTTGLLEVVHDLAYPLPMAVVSGLLGVPGSEQERIKRWGYDLAPAAELIPNQRLARRALRADSEAAAYFAELIEARRLHPRDDLLSELIGDGDGGSPLSTVEVVQTCVLILVAGFVTTVNLVSNGVMLLLQHPEQALLLAENRELVPNAVEEMLRFESPIQYTQRYALDDCVIGGVAVPAGRSAVLAVGAANRDPEVFQDPDTFDITRTNASRHLAFASGIHHCLGAALARMEGQVTFEALLHNGRRVEPAGAPKRRPLHNLRGLETLAVRFAGH